MTPRCPRCNQFLPLLGVHRCPCDQPRDDVDAFVERGQISVYPDAESFLASLPSARPTRIGHYASLLALSVITFTGLLVVAGNSTPREGPDASTSHVGAPASLGAPPEGAVPVPIRAPSTGDENAPGTRSGDPSSGQPVAASLPVAEPIRTTTPVPTPPSTDTDSVACSAIDNYRQPGKLIACDPTVRGIASHMGDSPAAGPGYLALPIGPGHRVRLCGAMGCLVVISNDAGPALFMQRRGRVADLSVELFERLTGFDRSRGLAPISWREVP